MPELVSKVAHKNITLRLLIEEAMIIDQQLDKILWRPDGTAKELSEKEKVELAELKKRSAQLRSKVQQLKASPDCQDVSVSIKPD